MATITSREFNQDVSAAKRQAATEPVIVTDRGEPAFVLLSIDSYRNLTNPGGLVERLSMDDDLDIEFEPLPLTLKVPEL